MHFGNINPRPTPDILFSLLYASEAAWNESRFKSEKFDKMLTRPFLYLHQPRSFGGRGNLRPNHRHVPRPEGGGDHPGAVGCARTPLYTAAVLISAEARPDLAGHIAAGPGAGARPQQTLTRARSEREEVGERHVGSHNRRFQYD